MTCSEFENKIFLYDELTASDKALLDSHRNDCNACSQLADQFIQSQALIRKVSAVKADVKDPHQLTLRIMNSIVEKNQVNVIDKLTFYLDTIFVRFAFSTVSLLLVGFFLYELPTIDHIDSKNQITRNEIKSGPVLDMKLFLNTYRKQRANKEPTPISKYAHYKSVRSVKTYNQ